MLIDYGTHLEVLVANLLLGGAEMRRALLQDANVSDIHSCRCIIQLAHGAVPKAPGKRRPETGRKGVQLTDELEEYIDDLKKCSTCYDYDPEDEVYIFDYWVNDQTRTAFAHFWKNALQLYASLHKLAMLNDLAIPRTARKRFRRDTKARRFASRLPEPQDEEKVFRFEAVRFSPQGKGVPVDYVSLSDGEHQLTQLLGVMCMQDSPGILFLLDEPESHFNPLWRVKCISRLLSMPTNTGCRSQENKTSLAAEQECILTTHAPFVPSDLPREHVFIFKKEDGRINVVHPDMETYGTTFDTILEQCFGVHPPISRVSLSEIERLRSSNNVTAIKNALVRIGDSVEKAVLMDRIHELANNEKSV
jgi:restriction system-associated AAA family ATPase